MAPSPCPCTEDGFDTAQKRRGREATHQTLAEARPLYPHTTQATNSRTITYQRQLTSAESCNKCSGADAQEGWWSENRLGETRDRGDRGGNTRRGMQRWEGPGGGEKKEGGEEQGDVKR